MPLHYRLHLCHVRLSNGLLRGQLSDPALIGLRACPHHMEYRKRHLPLFEIVPYRLTQPVLLRDKVQRVIDQLEPDPQIQAELGQRSHLLRLPAGDQGTSPASD